MDIDPRIKLPKIEFYITNVCNLACPNCNRFNDYNFSGWQKWSDYESIYAQWATKLDIQQLVILGGEPLLNPTICDWITGINQVFSKGVQVLTNGTRINQVADLYDALTNIQLPGQSNILGISIHNRDEVDQYLDEVRKFLKGSIKFFSKTNPADRYQTDIWGADFLFQDSNGLMVPMWFQDNFYNVAVHRNAQGNLTLHNNDPDKAHGECGFVKYKNYHFIRGKLYKCGPSALLPEFDQQHNLDISDEDRVLLNSYTPLEVNNFAQEGPKFLEQIDQVIPQCKFCPVNFNSKTILAVKKTTGANSSF